MASPCRKCGASKTDPTHHGFVASVAGLFGFRVRKCARCRRLRFLLPHEHTDEPSPSKAPASPQATPKQGLAGSKASSEFACPNCGSTDIRRSKRHWYERVLGRDPMARCRKCRYRFPRKAVQGMAEEPALPSEQHLVSSSHHR